MTRQMTVGGADNQARVGGADNQARVGGADNQVRARGRKSKPGRITFVGSGPGDLGLLTTRARTDEFGDSLYRPETDFAVVDRVVDVAEGRGAAPARVALAWVLHKPGVTAPIVGATKAEHVDDALAAEQLSLGDEEIERLEEPYVPHGISGH